VYEPEEVMLLKKAGHWDFPAIDSKDDDDPFAVVTDDDDDDDDDENDDTRAVKINRVTRVIQIDDNVI
jgi:hypothetical protein